MKQTPRTSVDQQLRSAFANTATPRVRPGFEQRLAARLDAAETPPRRVRGASRWLLPYWGLAALVSALIFWHLREPLASGLGAPQLLAGGVSLSLVSLAFWLLATRMGPGRLSG